MNRHCIFDGCQVWGGDAWMDVHERKPHGRCICGGWVGAVENLPWHRGHQPKNERGQHWVAEYLTIGDDW